MTQTRPNNDFAAERKRRTGNLTSPMVKGVAEPGIQYDPGYVWDRTNNGKAYYLSDPNDPLSTPTATYLGYSQTTATLKGFVASEGVDDIRAWACYYFQTYPVPGDVYTAACDSFTVFEITVVGGPGEGKGYIGRKETYSAGIEPSVLENQLGNMQWSGGGNPSGGSGATFSTRVFSEGERQIQASLVLGDSTSTDQRDLNVKDIFMYADGMIEYDKNGGIYPGNPNFGVYASKLVSGNGWDTSLVNLDENGDPSTPVGSDLWYNLFQEDLEHKANTLCNCRWMGTPPEEPVLRFGFSGTSVDLETFNWKGHTAPSNGIIDSKAEYQEQWNTGVIKFTATNCHGNSAHSWGVASLHLNPEDVKAQIENLGGTVTVHTNQTQSQILSNLAPGDILFFKHSSGGICHSAYVTSNSGTSSTLELWANNNGVPNKKAGYDIITLEQDLTHNNHHDANNFDYHKVSF